ncbi:sphingosine 1-phosphate receptor 1-like [Sinocyclocheilus anshuiensis]|uniref:sphingosine 1-phosphate receptor 1-like n=1 Tax=Sinocyclocheilus anshuiensis TaxID=1608454 RepID=UPI0007B79C76|nr:PREDICTED: sphingosine 1-phosphate receptor 1-like [Sinocyclocheilus anshuiensis]
MELCAVTSSAGSTNTSSFAFQDYHCNEVLQRHYNHTGKLDQNRYRDGLKPESIACLFICFLIVVENSVILMAIWKNKKFHMPMYYLLGNLTLSDLLAGFTYMLNIVLSGSNTLKLTPLLWFLREGGVFITLSASVISLLAIAIERYFTMLNTKPYHRAKRNRMFALIAASWALSLLLGALPIMGTEVMDPNQAVLPSSVRSAFSGTIGLHKTTPAQFSDTQVLCYDELNSTASHH